MSATESSTRPTTPREHSNLADSRPPALSGQHDDVSTFGGLPPLTYDSAEATRVSTPVPSDKNGLSEKAALASRPPSPSCPTLTPDMRHDEGTLDEKAARFKEDGSSMEAELPVLPSSEDDYPDGGLRAWLVVAGVSKSLQRCRLSLTLFQAVCSVMATYVCLVIIGNDDFTP